MRRLVAATSIILGHVLLLSSASAAMATFGVSGPPGEFVSQGQVWSFTYDDSIGSNIFVSELLPLGGSASLLNFTLQNPIDGTPADLALLSVRTFESGVPLSVGTFTLDGTATSPQISLGFQGRAPTLAGGSFSISTIQYDGAGELTNFAATWNLQTVNGPSTFPLIGSLDFSANATAVPEPSSLALLVFAGGGDGLSTSKVICGLLIS